MMSGEHKSGAAATVGREHLAAALDEAAALGEILELLVWAAEGIGGPQGAAVARGAMTAQDRLDALRSALMMTRES